MHEVLASFQSAEPAVTTGGLAKVWRLNFNKPYLKLAWRLGQSGTQLQKFKVQWLPLARSFSLPPALVAVQAIKFPQQWIFISFCNSF